MAEPVVTGEVTMAGQGATGEEALTRVPRLTTEQVVTGAVATMAVAMAIGVAAIRRRMEAGS
jgi:hypothetical protein